MSYAGRNEAVANVRIHALATLQPLQLYRPILDAATAAQKRGPPLWAPAQPLNCHRRVSVRSLVMSPEAMNRERRVIVASEAGLSIRTLRDISDAIGTCLGASLILGEEDLAPAFFDLKTGFAGELLQKLVNYQVRTAIVVASPESHGERFTELAREHATHPVIRFVATRVEADAWMRA